MSATVSIGCIFSSGQFSALSEPDSAPNMHVLPDDGFVLCRDENGHPKAVYGQSVWDFNPYRLSAKKIVRIRFDTVFKENDAEQIALIAEVKYIMYCLIYFSGGGRIGSISVNTLGQYWVVLRSAIQFCYEQKNKPLVGVVSLRQLFSVAPYLMAFVRYKKFDRGVLSGILKALTKVSEKRLGYTVLNPKNFNMKRESSNQHPVIPTRIYLSVINLTVEYVEQLYVGVDRLENFIECFSDEYYGLAESVQKSRGLGGKVFFRPNMSEAIKYHGLSSVLSGPFNCLHKRDLQSVLIDIQYLLKTSIHLYTGMRDQEVMRIPYNCIVEEVVSKAVLDDAGVERDAQETINIISTTTKFSGYKKKDKWFAPNDVVKVVEIAQAICRGLAKLYGLKPSDKCPLFLNPSIVGSTRNQSEIGVTSFNKRTAKKRVLFNVPIRPEDLLELAQSDPSRDFYKEPAFQAGSNWPLTSHQFRRSLAFYGSSSRFLSLPTLRTQYKHMTIEMARYYSNNYDNLRTLFGYYDVNSKGYVLPHNHFAFEYQMAIPMSVSNQLVADLMLKDEPLFGGTGSYMEKQKKRILAGDIHIEEVRADTLKRVRKGEINYRPTLLGGCTKVGRCDSFLLGDYTECLSCEGAIIKLDQLNSVIEDTSVELGTYKDGSGEHQVVQSELERLQSFKSRIAGKVGSL